MFTKADIRNGSTYLGVHLSANDYYAEGERIQGKWYGKLAERLGINGDSILPDDATFENLRLNLIPDGTAKLTPRKPEIRFFDFQCSAQKSISIMAVTLGDERLRHAHIQAFEIAFTELERFAACRVRNGSYQFLDQNRITGNVCAAVFHHDASRALDPQLHTHAVVANATYDPASGRVLALTEREMLKAIRYAGKVYQNELANRVLQLGYEIDYVRKNGVVEGFEIRGISPEIRQCFSKRRADVEAGIAEFVSNHGYEPSPAEIHAITTSTRSAKLQEITTPKVLGTQLAQLSAAEVAHMEGLKHSSASRVYVPRSESLLQHALEHLFERKSVFTGHQILAEALNQRLGIQDLTQLKSELQSEGGSLCKLVDSTSNPGLSGEFATRIGLLWEKWSANFINLTRNTCPPLISNFDERITEPEMPVLRPDQLAAAKLICTSPDQVTAVRGVAGAGKTYMLKAIDRLLRKSDVYYIAPTSSAANTLRSEGLSNATTCSDFLQNIAQRHDLHGAVVICDEAGLQSNKQGFALFQLAAQKGIRICFVGDSRQHVSVEAGDFLRVMETYSDLQTVEIGRIERQIHTEYRDAIHHMAAGHVRAGLEKLDQLGWIIEGKADYIGNAAADYLDLTRNGESLDDCLAVCPTWRENYQLTDDIRARLKATGHLRSGTGATVLHSLKWTTRQKSEPGNYHPGMVITFTGSNAHFRRGQSCTVARIEGERIYVDSSGRETLLRMKWASTWDVAITRQIEISAGDKILIQSNSRSHGLTNGDRLTVIQIESDGTLHTREGKIIPPDFKHWCHGYVVTSHKSQGATTKNVVVAAAMLDRKSAYVACSRGRRKCVVHTPNKLQLFNRLPSGDRKSALETVNATQVDGAQTIAARAELWEKLTAGNDASSVSHASFQHGLAQQLLSHTVQTTNRAARISH